MKFKKSISLALVMCMVLSLFASFVVSAEGEAEGAEPVELLVSHHNLYNWGTFESMVISGDGKTVKDVISQTPYWWIVYVVENIDGKYVATKYYKNCDEVNTITVPAGGFLYYVYSENSNWADADNEALIGYTFVLSDWSLEDGQFAIDTSKEAAKTVLAYAPVNVALNKTYTLSGCGERTSYYAKLTDGVALEKLTYSNDDWFGFYCNGEDASVINAPDHLGTVVVDLEEVSDLSSVRVNTFFGSTSGITNPTAVALSVSEDGETFTEVETKSYEVATESSVSWITFELEDISARYVKLDFTLYGTFVFINEIEAYTSAVIEEPEVPEEPAYKEGLTVELPEEVVVLGGAELDVVEGALVDGKWAEEAKDWQNTSGVYCFQNTVCTDGEQHPEVSLVYNFGEEAVVTGVKLGLYSNYGVMIGYPDAYIAAYVSEDGENWEFATGLYHELVSEAETNGTSVVELVPYYALVGQYVKLVLTFADSPFTTDGKVVWEFVGVTEVAFETVSYDEGLTIELPEEVVVLGGAELDVVEGALVDGKWAEEAKDWQNTSGVYCFQNTVCTDGEQHPEINFIYNFGEVTEFNTVKLGLYSNYGVMIGYPDAYVYVYTSNNGADWEFADAVSHELVSVSETNGTSVVALTLADYAQAQYVKLVLAYPDSPFTTDGKVVWEFMGVTEVAFELVINAQPDELVALPEGAPVIHLAGYTHGSFNYIMYADADMTFAELVTKYYGEAKDLNYFKVIVVNEDGTIDATYLTLGRPDGVKSDFTVKEGQLLLCLSGNVPGYEVADTYNVGDIVTLYNINLDYLKKVEISGGVELTDVGFTVAAPQVLVEGVNQLTVPAAGSTVTLTNFDTDMVLTIEGLWSVTVVIDGIEYWPNRMGVLEAPIPAGENTVIFKNGDATAVDVYATVAAPVHGDSMDDPLVLEELGDITASVNDTYPEGVYYQYVATATGKLTLTIKSEGGWMYVINNLTAGIYGDMQWSDSDPVALSTTIEVTEGDVIEFLVATYDPDSWAAPEGTVEFNVTEGEPVSSDPEADSKLSISDAIALGESKEHNTYTEGKYYVTGVITEVYNTTYGNMKITDENGNILTIYGTYGADGADRYDKLETKPVVGDTVTIYGIIGQYSGAAQIKNGWIVEHTPATPAFEEGLTIDIDLDLIGWLEAADLEAIKALLTDGKWAEDAKDWNNATGVVAIQNKVCTDAGINPAINLIWNFGEITKVNTVKLGLYANYNVMIGYPDAKIAVYTSANGKDWTEAGVLDTGLTIESATNGTAVVTLALDKAVETQFVKAVLVFPASPFEAQGKPVWEFIGLSEVEFSLVVPEDPEADSKLSISDAIALGESKDHNTYTEGKYYVTGVITEVYNTTYGNMKITDENGNILTIYGTYGADGELRYDALEVKPVVGDTVTIYGIIGQYSGAAQIKNGWIVEHTSATPELPEGATAIDILGYTHDAFNYIMYADADMTLGELVTKYYGQSKDLNYFKVIVVNEDGTIDAVYLTLGRPDGVKTDFTVKAGQIVIALSANVPGYEVADSFKAGDTVVLHNIEIDTIKAATESTTLTGVGFTVVPYVKPVVNGTFAEEGLNGVNQFAANAHNIWTGSVASIEWWTKALLQWNDEAQGWEVLKVQGNGKVDWVTEGNQIVIAAHADNGAAVASIAALQVGDIVYIWDIGVATSDKLSADVDCNGGFYTTDATKTGTTAFTYKEKVALAGDVNMDGVINDADYMIIRKLVVGTADAADYTDEQLKLADVNGNGAIDANDYLVVKRHALGTYVIPAWK